MREVAAMADRPPDPTTPTVALYCRRCGARRPLGILAPGRYWSRQNGRTVIVEGGIVRVFCERCSAEHVIDLRVA